MSPIVKKTKIPPVYRRVEDVIGCKWSVAVVQAIAAGVVRPGALEREIPGISTKVLNERLRKLSEFGMITRTAYDEKPFRVEYRLTPLGRKLGRILSQIRALQEQVGGA